MAGSSGAQQVIKTVLREGMNGAWLKKDEWAKWGGLAKHMIEEVPGGAEEICRVAANGMQHVWPFIDGRSWTIFDLWKNYSKANAEANKRQLEADAIDLAEASDAEA